MQSFTSSDYIMEQEDESIRLDVKVEPKAVREQAAWCGVQAGMRVLDAGCGSGKTTAILRGLVEPGGSLVGIDYSPQRIDYARKHYECRPKIEFIHRDMRESLHDIGTFDIIWVRFVLEHYRDGAIGIIENLSRSLKPGGYLCLLDLDYNCLSHYPMKQEMEWIIHKLTEKMAKEFNHDPYVGRKLYTYLHDLNFRNIEVSIMPHHLIYGDLKSSDEFNWSKKLEMASLKAKEVFEDYPGGYNAFLRDFNTFFHDPRRFTYSPLILCKAMKPISVN